MEELDADERRLSAGGRYAERDIVQVKHCYVFLIYCRMLNIRENFIMRVSRGSLDSLK